MWFVGTYGKDSTESVCYYFPVQHLTVMQRVQIAGVLFMPLDDPDVPEGWLAADSSLVEASWP